MITEWGTIEANRDGGIDQKSVTAGAEWMHPNHLSHVTKVSGSTEDELTANGRFLRALLRGN